MDSEKATVALRCPTHESAEQHHGRASLREGMAEATVDRPKYTVRQASRPTSARPAHLAPPRLRPAIVLIKTVKPSHVGNTSERLGPSFYGSGGPLSQRRDSYGVVVCC